MARSEPDWRALRDEWLLTIPVDRCTVDGPTVGTDVQRTERTEVICPPPASAAR